jgi:hypothetical protein
VKATGSYAAKRALIDRFTTLAATIGNPLYGVQVADSYPRALSEQSIYGGGARFTQDQETAEPGLRFETVTTGLYVRVLLPVSVREAETAVETLADAAAAELATNPELAGGLTFTQITGGTADFYTTDSGVEAILALSVQIESHLT